MESFIDHSAALVRNPEECDPMWHEGWTWWSMLVASALRRERHINENQGFKETRRRQNDWP